MGGGTANFQVCADIRQFVISQPRKSRTRQRYRIDDRVFGDPATLRPCDARIQEPNVERSVVRQHHRRAAGQETQKFWQYLLQGRLTAEHVGRDAVDLRRAIGNFAPGIDQLLKPPDFRSIRGEANSAEFDDLAGLCAEPRGFEIECDELQIGEW